MQRISLSTPDGAFSAWFSDRGLARLEFPARSQPKSIPTSTLTDDQQRWRAQLEAALTAALAGKSPRHLPPLDLRGATEFRQRVWAELLRIPAGQTRSYGEVATALRQPGAARAVGQACGANPIPVLIPCHRVLAAGGAIGGFSSDPAWKRRLLAREGAAISNVP